MNPISIRGILRHYRVYAFAAKAIELNHRRMTVTTNQVIEILNNDLCNEYKHMLFYLHAANTIKGFERLYMADMFKKHAMGEMEHVMAFAHKISGYGGFPVSGLHTCVFEDQQLNPGELLSYALSMEREVVANYHEQHRLFQEYGDISLTVFMEDQIEDSQRDIDELVQLFG